MSNGIITPNLFGRIFGSWSSLEVTRNNLAIIRSSSKRLQIEFDDFSTLPIFSRGLFGGKLVVPRGGGEQMIFPLVSRSSKESIDTLLKQVGQVISKKVLSTHKNLYVQIVEHYLRDSSIYELDRRIQPLLSEYRKSKDHWNQSIAEQAIKCLSDWEKIYPIETHKDSIRHGYEARRLKQRKKFFDVIESNPLTEQQRLAVIRENDRNLVLAAAGTGKTSVMVAKALDLIDSKRAASKEVLVLAYNRAASLELKERVAERSSYCGLSTESAPEISTFHALGLNILKQSGVSTYLSNLSEDPTKLWMWVNNWLVKFISSSPAALRLFLKLQYQPINPFEFETREQYDGYVRDNEYRTLQGERVKGYQELLIANWLYVNGVEYEYEAPYVSKRRVEVGFDYRPDFHIKGTNIYLEHFGVDRTGNTRQDIDHVAYNASIDSKRSLHEECRTVLLETYHYDWVEDKLEARLKELIHDAGIETKERSEDEILSTLKEMGVISDSSKRYMKCLQAMRVERLDKEGVLSRLKKSKITFAKWYAELLNNLHSAYVKHLEQEGHIDFDDMIIRAINVIKEQRFKPKWKHILVDEFQDISMARMEFLKALVDFGPAPILTVVGDDWQSIYRFSGGKLELTTRFDDLVGTNSITKLEKTFRYNNSIAETAGAFVMQNPEQYEKNVVTHTNVNSPQVFLLDTLVNKQESLEERVAHVVETIRANDPNGKIAILARYRYLLTNSKECLHVKLPSEKPDYWTFHGSKGLEADYCILVGFFQGKSGFPNMNKEEAVVEALLPSLDKFPHSEERRLLYVAITRAKKKCYIIADPMAPSEFVNELLSPKYKINIASRKFEEKYRRIFKCPVCTDGYFKLRSGKFGRFYSCTTGSVCEAKPRICEKCGAPSLDGSDKSTCNNEGCRNEFMICDRCGRPMKLREGKYGKFWGCTGYGIKDDQCRNTRKYV